MNALYSTNGHLRQIGGKSTDPAPYDRCLAVFLWQGDTPTLAPGYENAGIISDGAFTLTETGDTFLLIDPSQITEILQTEILQPDWGNFVDLLTDRTYLIAALGVRYPALLTRLARLQASLTQWQGAQDGLLDLWNSLPVLLSADQRLQLNQDFVNCDLPLEIGATGALAVREG